MKVNYKGFEIEVFRDKSMGGDTLLYFSIFREADGYECLTSFEDSSETVREKIKHLKNRIDNELATEDPWEEGYKQ